ncbi:galactan 5-O-arabinofuranosyltransferase [Corynebacterium pilosum]|uniref:Galactan 5-O-arabinofuranosyltransferase n=1 Tax=Corynebacterium pilosum TaxID=35756 RepID=A0A376CM67_9CORY|nr:galactan 5-O-arabinofuranosyltransferase [Corynebacterium pilosum]STC69362.1 arabinofuranosyl transferase A [Corynebacterium pilosum]
MTVSPTEPNQNHGQPAEDSGDTPPMATTGYAPDAVSSTRTYVSVLVYAALGGVLSLLAWFVLRSTSLPAFSTSNVTRAISSAATIILVVAVVLVVLMWLRDANRAKTANGTAGPARPKWKEILSEVVCYLAPAGLVITSLGIPLSATKLYLDGIQVDQGFRTQFLTRMTETAANQDMNYIDMPTYYPIGWFWLGGRLANILNLAGWEVYQPWALVSIAMAAAALGPVWRKILGSLPVATAVALVTTSIVLVMAPDEPYAAVVALFVPAMLIVLRYAMTGSWPATIGVMLFLGVSACFYTLYTGVAALAVVILGIIMAVCFTHSWGPVIRTAVIGFGSIAIALLAWGPYLAEVLSGAPMGESTAPHFLPEEGTTFPVPFLAFSVVGVLCLLGLIYLIVRFVDPDVRMLGIGLIVFYLWVLASMVATLAGTTLLGFRVETLIVLTLATAGVLALADIRLVGIEYLYPARFSAEANRRITIAFVVIVALGGLYYVQNIPGENESHIDRAYQDTDGNGERADRYAPDAGRYYKDVDETIRAEGHVPSETVIYTDEINFMSYYPYHGFNAFTSHYANPLGQFDERNDALRNWATASYDLADDPDAFIEELESTPWEAPQAFVFRGSTDSTSDEVDPWKTHIAEDIFPSQPNVRYEGLFFNPAVFDSPEWETSQVGPFVVAVRTQ